MKNKILVVTLIVLFAFGALVSMAACSDALATPADIAVRGYDLSWKMVPDAVSYDITVTGEDDYSEKGSSENGFYKLEITKPGVYTITVIAVAADGRRSDPGEFVYTFKGKLVTPSKPDYDAATGVLTWDTVEHAASYSVRIADATDDDVDIIKDIADATYTLDTEKYNAETDAYDISVAAIADPDGLYSDSEYSEAIQIGYGKKLAVPEISSVDTRIRWTAVSGASGYDIKLTNKDDETIVYTLPVTNSSVTISSFDIKENGAYDITLCARGDGEVYFDSDWSDPNSEYVVYKLADFADEDEIKVSDVDEVQKLIFTVSEEQEANVQRYTVSALPVEGDGSCGSALARTITVDADKETPEEDDDWTVTDNGDGSKTYYVDLDAIFFDKEKRGEKHEELAVRNYGRLYKIRIQARRDSSDGVIDGEATVADGEYQSYLKPDDGANGYQVSNAGELAYMHFEPDKNFVLTANIDMDGYMWRTVSEFSGSFTNVHTFSLIDITYMSDDNNNVAFIGTLAEGASVTDIAIVNASASSEGEDAVALLVAVNNGTIDGCFVSGTVDAGTGLAGGLVAVNNGSIDKSAAYADVSGAVAGGLAGANKKAGTIYSSSAFGTITASYETPEKDEEGQEKTGQYTGQYKDYVGLVEAGGFVAVNEGIVFAGSFEGNVSASNSAAGQSVCAGGFVAYNSGAIRSSYAGAMYSNYQARRNVVSASSDTMATGIAAGGFVGVNESDDSSVGEWKLPSGSISGSYANVHATASTAGGFVGNNKGTIEYSYSIGGVENAVSTQYGFAGSGSEKSFTGCVFYDDRLPQVKSIEGVERVDGDVDFNNVGSAIAEKLEGQNFVKTEWASNPVIEANLSSGGASLNRDFLYVATADRHITLNIGVNYGLTVHLVGGDGTLSDVTFDVNGSFEEETVTIMVFGDEFADGSSTESNRSQGDYVVRISTGSSAIYVLMTIA